MILVQHLRFSTLHQDHRGEDLEGLAAAVEVLQEECPASWFSNPGEPAGPPPKRLRKGPAGPSGAAASSAIVGGSSALAMAAPAAAAASAALATAGMRGDDMITISRRHMQAILDGLERAAKCAAHAVRISRAARDGFEDLLGTFFRESRVSAGTFSGVADSRMLRFINRTPSQFFICVFCVPFFRLAGGAAPPRRHHQGCPGLPLSRGPGARAAAGRAARAAGGRAQPARAARALPGAGPRRASGGRALIRGSGRSARALPGTARSRRAPAGRAHAASARRGPGAHAAGRAHARASAGGRAQPARAGGRRAPGAGGRAARSLGSQAVTAFFGEFLFLVFLCVCEFPVPHTHTHTHTHMQSLLHLRCANSRRRTHSPGGRATGRDFAAAPAAHSGRAASGRSAQCARKKLLARVFLRGARAQLACLLAHNVVLWGWDRWHPTTAPSRVRVCWLLRRQAFARDCVFVCSIGRYSGVFCVFVSSIATGLPLVVRYRMLCVRLACSGLPFFARSCASSSGLPLVAHCEASSGLPLLPRSCLSCFIQRGTACRAL